MGGYAASPKQEHPSVSNDSRSLRLYVEEVLAPPALEQLPGWGPLCSALSHVTGWTLSCSPSADGKYREVLTIPTVPEPKLPRQEIVPLTRAVGELVLELQRTRVALWEREAELAAGVPVRARRDEESHLAARLEAVLRSGAEAIGVQAAAAYLLDESTSELKLRSSWGLSKQKLLEPARPLRGSIADLEALLGHAVVLEDALMVRQWRAPEEFPSAVCVPISTPSIPLGTLWFYCDRERAYSPQQTGVLEIVAGRLAAELEREILLGDAERQRSTHPNSSGSAEAWRSSRQPTMEPMVDGWEFAGHSTPWSQTGGGYFDWSILPDGNLSLAVGHGHGKGDQARLNAAALHGMMKVLANSSIPRNLVRIISDSFWTASNGDQWASLAYLCGNPETGELLASNAGCALVMRIAKHRAQIAMKPQPALGTDPDCQYSQRKLSVESGDTIIAGVGARLESHEQRQALERRMSQISKSIRSADDWARALRNDPLFAASGNSSSSFLVVRRLPTTA